MLLLNTIRRFRINTSNPLGNSRVINLLSLIVMSSLLVPATNALGQTDSAEITPQSLPSTNTPPPKAWIDADTGHRVVRLTDEANSRVLPTGNAYTPDGRDMVYVAPRGIHLVNLATFKTKLIISGGISGDVIVGTKTRRVFYQQSRTVYFSAVDIDTGKVTHLGTMPPGGFISSINADETLAVGTVIKPGEQNFLDFYDKTLREHTAEIKSNHSNTESIEDAKQKAMKMRLDARIPESMFVMNLQTGEVKTILQGTDWLSHAQFSPTDPTLIMYEHEGPYAEKDLDRVWTIRSDGSQNKLVHPRLIPGETTAHPFWSQDGKTIWYERRKPKHDDPTWSDHHLVGFDVTTGNSKLFYLDQLTASTFYSPANNGAFFCGSGHYSKAAHGNKPPTQGQIQWSGEWIYVYYPILNNTDIGTNPQDAGLFHFNNPTSDPDSGAKFTGWFRREPLVNMFKNDYTKLEPNVRFSPDNKLVIFTSNMFGPTYVFAVEVN